ALPFLQLQLSDSLWLLLLLALALLAFAVVVLSLAAWRPERTLAGVTRLLVAIMPASARHRVEPFMVGFVDALLRLIRQPRLLLVAALYTLVAVGLDALFCLLAFRAVGAAVAIPVVLYGYTFYNLAYILPTPPGQIGSNEV